MPFDSNKRLKVLIPKGRFFRAISKYFLKDTALILKSENASISWKGECNSPLQ
jgi:hypothetical protein